MTEATKDAFVLSTFTDAGAGKNFTAGTIVQLSEGEFLNHEHAGLVRAPTAEDRPAAKTEKTSGKSDA